MAIKIIWTSAVLCRRWLERVTIWRKHKSNWECLLILISLVFDFYFVLTNKRICQSVRQSVSQLVRQSVRNVVLFLVFVFFSNKTNKIYYRDQYWNQNTSQPVNYKKKSKKKNRKKLNITNAPIKGHKLKVNFQNKKNRVKAFVSCFFFPLLLFFFCFL